MDNCRTIVFAPHDDGHGAFAVLCRVARALVNVADENQYALDLYFLNSSAAVDGQKRVNDLVHGKRRSHRALFVPTDNLIWLPKDRRTAAVIGGQIPDILRKWVRPLWHSWPCEPNWIRTNLPLPRDGREDWIRPDFHDETLSSAPTWKHVMSGWGNLRAFDSNQWRGVALGISMGVPQLHRVARRERFPSVEVGDWFFSVGLRGCMRESRVREEVIAATEPDLRMIEEDEFKANEAWMTLYQAPRQAYLDHLASSAVRVRVMQGALWSGDALPTEGVENWRVSHDLRNEIRSHIARVRGLTSDQVERVRIAYIVTGKTGVWDGVVRALREANKAATEEVAVIDLNRADGKITLLESTPANSQFVSETLAGCPSEEKHLATCRASDFGVTRSAGGVLGFAETRRPSVLVDEPGHWLGHLQSVQCLEAGICVLVPFEEFLSNPTQSIQIEADKIGSGGELDATAIASAKMQVGAERDLAEYLFRTYLV